jgi:hypothetical protein
MNRKILPLALIIIAVAGISFGIYVLWGIWNPDEPVAEPVENTAVIEATPAILNTQIDSLPIQTQNYTAIVSKDIRDLADSLVALGDLIRNPKFGDENWKIAFGVHVAIIRLTHEKFVEMTPPPELTPLHNTVLNATSDCHLSMDNLLTGLNEQNTELINEGATLMQSCAQKLREVTDLLNEQVTEAK